ncbi:MAG: hypothetical protein AB1690_11245 [Candidatus Zixiibacteriota bacterium]
MFLNINLRIISPLIFAALSILIPLIACNDTVTVVKKDDFKVVAKLTNFSNCKPLTPTHDSLSCALSEEGVNYHYDGKGRLILKHINAGFNCCGQPFTAEIVVNDSAIIITESESAEQVCHCLCLYDLEYEFNNLPEGNYQVEFNGLYLSDGETGLKTSIAAVGFVSGSFCLKRDHYPWLTMDYPPGPSE